MRRLRQGYRFIRNWNGWTFRAAIWKRKLAPCSSFCLLAHSCWKSACFVVRSLPHWPVMLCPFFNGSWWFPPLLKYFLLVRRRMCKITDFPLCYPLRWLLWNSSKFHSILKYTKRLMFEMLYSKQVFYYSGKGSRPIDVLRKLQILYFARRALSTGLKFSVCMHLGNETSKAVTNSNSNTIYFLLM